MPTEVKSSLGWVLATVVSLALVFVGQWGGLLVLFIAAWAEGVRMGLD